MIQAIVMLLGAIIAEVFGSTMLKKSDGFKKVMPTVGFLVGYTLAFVGLALALVVIPLGVSYAIWSGVGTALTAIAGVLFFKEALHKKLIIGVALVIIGVIVLNLGK